MQGFSGMLINLKMMKMKIIYNILLSITALALLTLTSCLDDSLVDTEVTRFDEAPDVVDFNEKPNSDGYITRSFKGTTDPTLAQEASFRVNLSSQYTLDYDLVLTVEYDQAAADAYAAANTGWVSMDPAKQDFTSTTVTIPAGEREADFTVNFYTQGLSADDRIVAAYTITDVDDPDVVISGNFGTQYVRVVVANVFEGSYTADIDWFYGGGGNYGGLYDDWQLVTASSVACTMDYFYPGWGYTMMVEVDFDNPQTIDGHDNAYFVTLYMVGSQTEEQLDDYNGGVWNYGYQDGGKWIFKFAHAYTSGSGTHVGVATLTQN
jgi:hypothetical protein